MADDEIRVEAQHDTFLRIARARPLTAIAELVWNSLDADADNVTVYLDENEFGLRGIVVEDDGLGATPEEAKEFFRRLGGSWKKPGARTKKGRILHGSQGQGRYKSLSLGQWIRWTFFYRQGEDIYQFPLTVTASDPARVEIGEPELSNRGRTGCIVEIREPVKQFKNLADEEAALTLTELLAIYLCDYPGIKVSLGGTLLDPEAAISSNFQLTLSEVTLGTGETAEAIVRVVEWKHLDRRTLFICDSRGFALQQVPTKFQLKGHSFSGYLLSPHFETLDAENRLEIAELDPLGAAIIEAAKETIKAHYDAEERQAAAKVIEEWKAADIYPYRDAEPKDQVEAAERKVFNIVAVKLQTAHSELAGAPKLAKKLQLELLRHAIETGPNQVRELLAKVIDLPKREQDDLAKLLEQTTLSSIIGAAKVVTDRLNFLRGLYQVVYEYTATGRIKERTQLHRIVAQNPWLFGEEFSVSTDDRDLTAVLIAHKKFLDEDVVIDAPVKHVSQSRGIVDLVLSRLLRRYRADEVEHLVVELKRPGVAVGQEEINQVSKYAASIEADGRFATRKGVVWHYWVISDALNQMGKWEVEKDATGRGLIRDTPRTKIYVRTWDELIEENKARYQFIRERLNFTADDAHAMRYLREEYDAFLEGVTVDSDEQERNVG